MKSTMIRELHEMTGRVSGRTAKLDGFVRVEQSQPVAILQPAEASATFERFEINHAAGGWHWIPIRPILPGDGTDHLSIDNLAITGGPHHFDGLSVRLKQ
jgi:hypothetical protein